MHLFARSSLAIASVVVLATTAHAKSNILPDRMTPVPANEPIPVIDFVRPYRFEFAKLNPSGTYFAAFAKNEILESNLLICELATGKVSWSKSGVWRFEWIDDRHIQLNDSQRTIISVDKPGDQAPISSLLDLGKRGLMRDTGFMWTWPLPEMPTNTGRVQAIWHRLEDGQPLYCQTIQQDSRKHLYRRDGRSWVECPVDLDEIMPVALGAQAGELLVIGPAAKGSPRPLQRLDPLTGKLGEVVYRDAKYDCSTAVIFRRDTHQVIGVKLAANYPRTVWLDERMKEVQAMIDQQFPKTTAEIVSFDVKLNRFLLKVESDRQPPVIHLLDFEKKSLSTIERIGPWFDPARLARMQMVTFQTRDGVTLDAALTLPAGVSKEHPAPLIISVHAGPWNYQEDWRFDRDTQYLASRGYAVFAINYRGSQGCDSRYETVERFDFQKMANDVVDGTRAALTSGVFDPKRVAVSGIGFGAYLALTAAMDEPELYRGAVLAGGMFDWEKQFRKTDSPERYTEAWMQRRVQEAKFTFPAPLQNKDRIKIPLFLARNVSAPDTTLDTQVFELYLAMKGRVSCEFYGELNIQTPNEAYDKTAERLELIDKFLAKHLAAK